MKCGIWGSEGSVPQQFDSILKLLFLEASDDFEILQPLSANGSEIGYTNQKTRDEIYTRGYESPPFRSSQPALPDANTRALPLPSVALTEWAQ